QAEYINRPLCHVHGDAAEFRCRAEESPHFLDKAVNVAHSSLRPPKDSPPRHCQGVLLEQLRAIAINADAVWMMETLSIEFDGNAATLCLKRIVDVADHAIKIGNWLLALKCVQRRLTERQAKNFL